MMLTMPRDTLKFDFGDDNVSLEKFMTDQFPLTNPGNAPAKFSWQLPNQQAFTVSPREGVVKPGQTMFVEFTYQPPANTTESETYATLSR